MSFAPVQNNVGSAFGSGVLRGLGGHSVLDLGTQRANDAPVGHAQFHGPYGGNTPLQTIPADVVAKALDVGERSIGMKGVSMKDAIQAVLRGAPARAFGVASAVLAPTNRTEPFTYQFAPDLRGRQRLGESTVTFERRVDGDWQAMPVRGQMGQGGMQADLSALQKAYGRPLPQAMSVTQPAENMDRLCRDLGTWVPDTGYAAREVNQPGANRYQDYVGGHPGMQFRVMGADNRATAKVDYDGCRDTATGPVLLEAKGSHLGKDGKSNIGQPWYKKGNASLPLQAEHQKLLADQRGVRLEYHVQTEADLAALRELFKDGDVAKTVTLIHNPMPGAK